VRLAITRVDQQLGDLKSEAASRGVEVIGLPVTQSEPVPFELPSDLQLESIDWLTFTSARGVTCFFDHLKSLNVELPSTTKIAVVGDQTGRALKEYQRTADFVPSTAGGKALFDELIEQHLSGGNTVVYPQAREISYEPLYMLRMLRINYVPVVCYRTTSQQIVRSQVEQLTKEDYILFTAPSAIDSYQQQIGLPIAKPIAIGPTTAARMSKLGWTGYITMQKPVLDNVLEYLSWN
jgi:uroporphyrinogen-III synthase